MTPLNFMLYLGIVHLAWALVNIGKITLLTHSFMVKCGGMYLIVISFFLLIIAQYSSQQSHGEASNSQPSHSQQMKCTQEEIARKKEAAQRLREQKQRQRHMSGHYRPVC